MNTLIRSIFLILLFNSAGYLQLNGQNTSPLPAGETVIGNHLHAGMGNEVWTSSNSLYFNYRGTGASTYFWNLQAGSGSPIMTLLNNGFVGIGTSTPISRLHINSSVERETLRIYKQGNTSNYLNIWQGTGAGAIDPIGTGKLYLGYDQVTDVYMGLNGGKIGIGTTSPTSNLTINGTGTVEANIATDAITSSRPVLSFSRGSGSWNLGMNMDAAGTDSFHFRYNGTSYPLTLLSGGNVGIGTTTPDSKLTVKGTIHSQEVKVDLNGSVAPDYVFEKDYPLTSLKELKSYIEQNKHLPEIPSAKEMKEEGIDLKEMNLMLLKKIEELTLHVIELSVENSNQNRLIEKLSNKN